MDDELFDELLPDPTDPDADLALEDEIDEGQFALALQAEREDLEIPVDCRRELEAEFGDDILPEEPEQEETWSNSP